MSGETAAPLARQLPELAPSLAVTSAPPRAPHTAGANADFYDLPTRRCDNPMLVRCADSVVHVVRLGLIQLPGPLNPAPLHAAQAALLDALSVADPRAARRAIYRIAEIPLTGNTRQHD